MARFARAELFGADEIAVVHVVDLPQQSARTPPQRDDESRWRRHVATGDEPRLGGRTLIAASPAVAIRSPAPV